MDYIIACIIITIVFFLTIIVFFFIFKKARSINDFEKDFEDLITTIEDEVAKIFLIHQVKKVNTLHKTNKDTLVFQGVSSNTQDKILKNSCPKLLQPGSDGTCKIGGYTAITDPNNKHCCAIDLNSIVNHPDALKMIWDLGWPLFTMEITGWILKEGLPSAMKYAAKGITGEAEDIGVDVAAESASEAAVVMGETAVDAATDMAASSLTGVAEFLGSAAFSAGFALVTIGGMITDFFDPEGYDEFTANAAMELNRNRLENAFNSKMAVEFGHKPPYIGYCQAAFPKELTCAIQTWFTEKNKLFLPIYLKKLSTGNKTELKNFIEALLIPKKAKKNSPAMQHYKTKMKEYISNINNKTRDEELFKLMTTKLMKNSESGYIELHTEYSEDKLIGSGITLSQAGVNWINKKNANDVHKPFFLYTKYYRVGRYGPGNQNIKNPKMITKTLARPVSLISPLKTTTSCFNKNAEILKKINRNDLDPKKYGVTFNQDNGLCNYTSDFCDRVGLDYTVKNSIPDCTEDTGQKVAEAIVGKTITRGFKRAFGIPSYEKIHSGDCCTLGFTCNGCPGNSEFEWMWKCAGSRKCK